MHEHDKSQKPWSLFTILYSNLLMRSIRKYLFRTGASFEGGWGAVAPPPKEKEKKKKERKKEKKRKKEEKRKKGTINNVKLLHIKCCFFQFFNSPVALKNKKKFWPPKKKLKWRPWFRNIFQFFMNSWKLLFRSATRQCRSAIRYRLVWPSTESNAE